MRAYRILYVLLIDESQKMMKHIAPIVSFVTIKKNSP